MCSHSEPRAPVLRARRDGPETTSATASSIGFQREIEPDAWARCETINKAETESLSTGSRFRGTGAPTRRGT